MVWVVVGWALLVIGATVAITVVRRARRHGSTGAEGMAIGCGGGLAIWGGIIVVVATVLNTPG
ncbi:hypothetical protein [Oerskovia flava]|uniref:hypothetical protein n=1 Tax=Oerskovia flava TaxID=2986422 RepID=UPI00223FE890|nr:hypothetical protein [Oerskovia sp. JB1-3-2]